VRAAARPAHAAAGAVRCAIVTVSDTRGPGDDRSGAVLQERLERGGHRVVARDWVRDQRAAIRRRVGLALGRRGVAAVLVTGGTGVAPRDVTPETIEPRLERIVPGFGELFRMLSWHDVGSAALLSRALAGLAAGRVVFALPGSRGAVGLAMEKLVLPELGHLAAEAVKQG
jgi:molybdenum cofactor biosynthesis protein B